MEGKGRSELHHKSFTNAYATLERREKKVISTEDLEKEEHSNRTQAISFAAKTTNTRVAG